jgi:large subunit ribosomal protein L24e
MVIKTELCAYSQWKIYPGHGQRFVDKDGKSSLFLYKRSRIFALRFIFKYLEKLKLKN